MVSKIKNPHDDRIALGNFQFFDAIEYSDGRLQFRFKNGDDWRILTFGNETYKDITYNKTEDGGQTTQLLWRIT